LFVRPRQIRLASRLNRGYFTWNFTVGHGRGESTVKLAMDLWRLRAAFAIADSIDTLEARTTPLGRVSRLAQTTPHFRQQFYAPTLIILHGP
jgi:hypothetical protein